MLIRRAIPPRAACSGKPRAPFKSGRRDSRIPGFGRLRDPSRPGRRTSHRGSAGPCGRHLRRPPSSVLSPRHAVGHHGGPDPPLLRRRRRAVPDQLRRRPGRYAGPPGERAGPVGPVPVLDRRLRAETARSSASHQACACSRPSRRSPCATPGRTPCRHRRRPVHGRGERHAAARRIRPRQPSSHRACLAAICAPDQAAILSGHRS